MGLGVGPSALLQQPRKWGIMWHRPLPLVHRFVAVGAGLHQSHGGGSADSQAGQQTFNLKLMRRGQVQEFGRLWKSFCRMDAGKFRSGPSWRAPRKTRAPAFPGCLVALHRHWLSPPWSGLGPPGVRTADRSGRPTDASPGGPRPVKARGVTVLISIWFHCCVKDILMSWFFQADNF